MAVQQTRKSRSRRGKRRAHDFLTLPTFGEDSESGEAHLRHHITANGFYRGKQVLISKARRVADETDEVTAGA